MALILLALWGIGMMCLARVICGNWLNHLTLYTFVWTASLGLYELHWIHYNPITPTAWLYIFIAWAGIYLGTAFGMLGRRQLVQPSDPERFPSLKLVIIMLSLGGLASCVVLALQIMRDIDSNLLVAVTVGAPQIYQSGFEETGQFTGIPYCAFLPLAASAMAGAYAAIKSRIDWACLFPLLAATVNGILSVSRWAILLSVVLFLVALFLTPKSKRIQLGPTQKGLLVLLCLAGFTFVSFARNDLALSLTDQSPTLSHISEWVSVAPSVYFYLSGPPVGLSEYLRDPQAEANLPWGRYTFASIYRFLSKLGLAPFVPFHQEFYSTPEWVNTCTYIREIHSDFGLTGVFLFPFCVGTVAGRLSRLQRTLFRTMVLTHLYILVLFSYTNLVMSAGQWFQSFVVSLIASALLDRASRRSELRASIPHIVS